MAGNAPAHAERSGNAVVIRLDNPPVNVLGRPLRRSLLAELEAAERDDSVRLVVIAGKPNFSAGADLAEFDSGEGLAEPSLHLTIAGFLDAMTTPTVAAIEGAALGGGLELALACTMRIARDNSRLGLPETTLGFMPGAGGTQRLPRAIGIEAALDLIVTGRTVDGTEAARLGLVDNLAADPVAAALELSSVPPRRLRDAIVAEPLAQQLVDSARRAARRNPRASAGVRAALEALEAAVTMPFDKGLARELLLFERLATSPEARAARYRFLTERAAGKVAAPAGPIPTINTAAVIGAGTMGRGIALALLAAGIPTTLIDTEQDRVDAGRAAIADELERSVTRGRITASTQLEQLESLRTAVGLASANDVDLVIEAVFENLDVKREVFATLDGIARPGAILASNTSSLDLNRIAEATNRPELVVGLHFFSPANVMRLVEVVHGAATSDTTLAAAISLVRRVRKLPVVAQVGPGFIGNRIFDQYLRQAHLLLRTGASPERIDGVLESWGMAMGPFRVLDLVGNDVPALARTAAGVTDPAWVEADKLVAQGWLGRKTGLGWYSYGEKRPTPNGALAIDVSEPAVTDGEIIERCIFALVNEAAAVLADRVAEKSGDIDTVMVNGYGFPANRGGPWFVAEQHGWDRVVRSMARWRDVTGDPFWTPNPLLKSRETS